MPKLREDYYLGLKNSKKSGIYGRVCEDFRISGLEVTHSKRDLQLSGAENTVGGNEKWASAVYHSVPQASGLLAHAADVHTYDVDVNSA
jgi:hypothetical protein